MNLLSKFTKNIIINQQSILSNAPVIQYFYCVTSQQLLLCRNLLQKIWWWSSNAVMTTTGNGKRLMAHIHHTDADRD